MRWLKMWTAGTLLWSFLRRVGVFHFSPLIMAHGYTWHSSLTSEMNDVVFYNFLRGVKRFSFFSSPTSSLDECALLRRGVEPGRGADWLHAVSPPGQSVCFQDRSPADRPALSVGSLFNDSSIQHIIDRYTRELNVSLSTAGRTTGTEHHALWTVQTCHIRRLQHVDSLSSSLLVFRQWRLICGGMWLFSLPAVFAWSPGEERGQWELHLPSVSSLRLGSSTEEGPGQWLTFFQ